MFLQYALGLRRLGFDVLVLDRIEGEPAGGVDVRHTFDSFGVEFAVLPDSRRGGRGSRSRQRVIDRVRESDLFLNVMGFAADDDVLAAARKRVFLDIDPGFGQMWRELRLADVFQGHDAYVTVGENIGRADCGIPICGLDWITTRQPVVLDEWPLADRRGSAFTSVASWRGAYGPVEYRGKTYGLRVHEFRRFASLPRLTNQRLEVALDIHPAEKSDLRLLAENDWSLVDPRGVAGDPWVYRDYIQNSMAEFSVAKNMYVETRSGWFSDRSICYLASGKPVVVQDTGLRELYPVGEGLLVYSTLDEALACVEDVARNYAHHSRAAREVADEYFDSDMVLTRLVEKLGVV